MKIGDIFYLSNYDEGLNFAISNKCGIVELPIKDNQRQFQLVERKESDEEKKKKRNADLKFFLLSTDWYVIRQIETGEKIPQDISEQRAAARAELSK